MLYELGSERVNVPLRTPCFSLASDKTWTQYLPLVCSMHLSRPELCTTEAELLFEVKFYLYFHGVTWSWGKTLTNGSDVTKLRGHGDECWPTEVTSNTYFGDVTLQLRSVRRVSCNHPRIPCGMWLGPRPFSWRIASLQITYRSRRTPTSNRRASSSGSWSLPT